MNAARAPVVILVSGRGSNLQAILDETGAGRLPVDIRAVISNNPQAEGLERAAAAGVPAQASSPADAEAAIARLRAELLECLHPLAQLHTTLVHEVDRRRRPVHHAVDAGAAGPAGRGTARPPP